MTLCCAIIMSAMDPVIIIEVIHGSQKIANYTLDGYLCHIAIPAHAQLPKMDCPVRYDQGNYAVLHYIHNVRLVLYIQLGNLTSLYKDTLWSKKDYRIYHRHSFTSSTPV